MQYTDIGIDLGTASILVYIRGKGVVLKEPSVVAFDRDTNRIKAIGEDAREVIAAMYRAVLEGDVHEVSSPAVAEMEKILENTSN